MRKVEKKVKTKQSILNKTQYLLVIQHRFKKRNGQQKTVLGDQELRESDVSNFQFKTIFILNLSNSVQLFF